MHDDMTGDAAVLLATFDAYLQYYIGAAIISFSKLFGAVKVPIFFKYTCNVNLTLLTQLDVHDLYT